MSGGNDRIREKKNRSWVAIGERGSPFPSPESDERLLTDIRPRLAGPWQMSRGARLFEERGPGRYADARGRLRTACWRGGKKRMRALGTDGVRGGRRARLHNKSAGGDLRAGHQQLASGFGIGRTRVQKRVAPRHQDWPR